MQKQPVFSALLALFIHCTVPLFSQNETFQMHQVACNLNQPWEITYGPMSQTMHLDLTALPAGPVWVKAYNTVGLQVIDQQWDELPNRPLDVDISNWPTGQYLMSIQSMSEAPSYRAVQKISVQRRN